MTSTPAPQAANHYRRFLDECEHLARPFGAGSFGARAEAFARFFGTPKFLIGQTLVVALWIVINASGMVEELTRQIHGEVVEVG